MNYLLDSHALIWSVITPEKLSKTSREIIQDAENEIHVSHISFWEISIKYSLGKIDLHSREPEEIGDWCRKMNFKILPLSEKDVITFYKLPQQLHKDPFDRMLVWQALNRNFPIISNDALLKNYFQYGLRILW